MRICYIPTFNLPWCATSWRRALELGKAVSNRHEVTFMCPEDGIEKLKEMTTDVSIDIIPVRFSGNSYISKGIARCRALESFDIVHTFKPLPDIFPSGFAARFKKALWIADLDDLEGSKGFNRKSPLWKQKTMDFFEWFVPSFAGKVTVASKGLEEFYEKYDPFYIPNGANPDVFSPVESVDDKKTLLFMGLFHKDLVDGDMLIKAMAKVSKEHDVRLMLVGEGQDRPAMERMAKDINIDALFTGHVNNVPEVIAKADIGVISFRENLLNKCKCPLRLFEFMACGIPIVSTKVGEPSHILKDGAGLLVNSSIDSLAEGILTLLKQENLCNSIRDKAHKLIVEKYNWHTLGKCLSEYYENAI